MVYSKIETTRLKRGHQGWSEMEGLEFVAGRLLAERSLTVAVAESCTGGLLGARLTDVPGSSAFVLGGVIAYSDNLKRGVLGVPGELIRLNGAVSAEVAASMSRAVRALTGADIGISITGIAGPAGGTPAKPVGTTYIGISAESYERVDHFMWYGDRAGNREQSVEAALGLLIGYLKQAIDPTESTFAMPAEAL